MHQGSNILESTLREQGLESSDWEVIIFTPINLHSDDLRAKLDSSAGYLRRATTWDITNAEAYNTMAKANYLQGDPLIAIDALSRVNELRAQNALVHLTLGDIYDGLGLAEEAMGEYERSQAELRGTRVGERAEVNYLKLADAYREAGDPNRASTVCKTGIALEPNNPYALYHLAKIFESIGNGGRLLAAHKYEELRSFHVNGLDMPKDKRLDEFTAKVLPALVEDGIWSFDHAMHVISFWKSRGQVDLAETALTGLLEQHPEEWEHLQSY